MRAADEIALLRCDHHRQRKPDILRGLDAMFQNCCPSLAINKQIEFSISAVGLPSMTEFSGEIPFQEDTSAVEKTWPDIFRYLNKAYQEPRKGHCHCHSRTTDTSQKSSRIPLKKKQSPTRQLQIILPSPNTTHLPPPPSLLKKR